jgi:hypothetical protein
MAEHGSRVIDRTLPAAFQARLPGHIGLRVFGRAALRAGILLLALASLSSLLIAESLVSAQRLETTQIELLAAQAARGAASDQQRVERVTVFVQEAARIDPWKRTGDRAGWIQPPAGILGSVLSGFPAAGRFFQRFFEPRYESFLKPGAWQVYRWGSDCAGASRLMIRLLAALGIEASKLGLHDEQGIGRHAVVEARVDGRRVIADPLHGIVYPLPDGRLATAADLARQPDLARRFLKPDEDPMIANFKDARTINWSKIPVVMPLVYKGLHATLGDRVNHLPRPGIVETPKMLSATLFGGLGLLFLFPPVAVGLRRLRGTELLARCAAVLAAWRQAIQAKRQEA